MIAYDEQFVAFGGDRLHEADVVRCERLWGAARALRNDAALKLLLGKDPQRPGSTLQDASAALHDLLAIHAASPGACFLFSSNDRFSTHVARQLCMLTEMQLLGPIAAVRDGRLVSVATGGGQRVQSLASGQVLLIDDRYFPRTPSDPRHTTWAVGDSSPALPFDDFAVAADDVALPEAQLVLAGGDGVTDWDSFSAVARLLGATAGASKVVCDKGLQPRDRQVGSSGTAVAPQVYVALGISGSTQHLQGVAITSRILAVNTDPNAAIVRRAELTLVTDANGLLRALRAALEGTHP